LLLAALAETWSRFTGAPSVMSLESIRLMNARLAVTAAKAERGLGVTFRPFEDTIADTVAWAEAHSHERAPTTPSPGLPTATRVAHLERERQ
jgi:hypothetical protein